MCPIRRFILLCCLFGLTVALTMLMGCEPTAPAPTPPQREESCTPPKVLAFCATWCGPCQRAQPTLAWLAKHGVEVVHIDVDQRPELCKQYGVTSYPTFFLVVCHRETFRTQDVSAVVAACDWLKDKPDGTSHPTQELP